jgi:hypothetical protein
VRLKRFAAARFVFFLIFFGFAAIVSSIPIARAGTRTPLQDFHKLRAPLRRDLALSDNHGRVSTAWKAARDCIPKCQTEPKPAP